MLYLVRIILLSLKNSAARFKEGFAENGDVIVSLDSEDHAQRIRIRTPFSGEVTPRDKIRREYRKQVRRRRKEKPQPYETPAEIEQAAGIDDPALHTRYEQARYDSQNLFTIY